MGRFATLDSGEAEALSLASSWEPAIPILLDDERARRIARDVGLFVIGSAGILGRAKEAGFIPTVRPILSELRYAGLFLSEAAAGELLAIVGER